MALNDIILHRCTAAYKLISSLKEIISSSRASNSYPQWSDYFLSFCEGIADESLSYVESRLEISKYDPISYRIVAGQLSSLIQGWELLHAFIKPVIDADILRVPYPLIRFLSEHVGSLETVKDTKIVVELTPELNYHQHRHTRLKKVLTHIPHDKDEKSEPRLGFLGLPCSQSKSLFMNCLLYHEAGHFIAEETGVFSTERLDSLALQLRDDFPNYDTWAASTIQTWMEELFADLIAVKLLGPAYTLAYLELLRLVVDLSKEQIRTFQIDHPADALRLREQLKILSDDKWQESQISLLKQWKELEGIADADVNTYLPPDEDDPDMQKVWKKLMAFLCQDKIIEEIHKLVEDKTQDREPPAALFKAFEGRIFDYLSHGIVPSVSKKNEEIPHPIAVINGAVYFILSGMTELVKIVQGLPEGQILSTSILEQRVEMWCMKAIEDWLVRLK